MIIPTMRIDRHAMAGNDGQGQPVFAAPVPEMVCPVKLQFDDQHTTVRTDSAGSHGHAYETTANVVLLARKESKIALGDVLSVLSHKVRVIERHPRYRVTGALDHIEIKCAGWK